MVVPHSNSTSNHNSLGWKITTNSVVPHSNSTSNHNFNLIDWKISALFLIPILHQTTTSLRVCPVVFRCSSFQFYIKPQLSPAIPRKAFCCSSFQFYIKPQRSPALPEFPPGCSSFQFYIKPQHGRPLMEVDGVVPHSNSTSNHNLAHGSNSYSARYTYDTDA